MVWYGMGRILCRVLWLLDFWFNLFGIVWKFGIVVGCDLKVLDLFYEFYNGRSKNVFRFIGYLYKLKRNWFGEMLCNFFMFIGLFV